MPFLNIKCPFVLYNIEWHAHPSALSNNLTFIWKGIWKGMTFNIISYKKAIWKGIEGNLKGIVQKLEESRALQVW